MLGKNTTSKKKGKDFEKEISVILTRRTGALYKPTPGSGAMRRVFPGDIMKIGNKPSVIDSVILECKNHKTIRMPDWIDQVEEETKDAGLNKWLLFFKRKGKIYATMDISYLEKLLKP